MFIDEQPRRSSGNNSERNWRSQEETSATKDYRGQQQRSCHQPLQYNYYQQYFQNRVSLKKSSFNTYGGEKQYHHSNIHSEIPTSSQKRAPIIPNEPAQEHHIK